MLDLDRFISSYGGSGLFANLDRNVIADILSVSQECTAVENEYLLYEGDHIEYLFFILQGELITFRTNTQGDEVSVRLLETGDVCGDSVFFMDKVGSPIGIKALVGAKFLRIPRKTVLKLVTENIQFSNNIVSVLANFYQIALMQIHNLAVKKTKDRLGHFLLFQHLKKRHSSKDTELYLNFKKNVIANFLGMTPETLSRQLHALEKDDYIMIDKEEIYLSSPHSLCHFCDEDTAVYCKDLEGCPNKRTRTP
ncbi:hypothetical protein A6A19_08040 [Actinobacillus delphinicola]|uniref:Fumarate/nitrate reduction transcriptional regulator n=1 Tax=Actinobacillus delphinicola TaxID=51161 RepID=A0A448TV42_9PAST|nr:Crp/Fnr family transcriptional regulator [Actinobacillus delphinicola]MDG6897924.1 hypothetical protein [Actinobacillus delphinicola]VEJ09790.1 fumarate/nitrate reduction transcriptional regulator [Actinobacillus delphinicola]